MYVNQFHTWWPAMLTNLANIGNFGEYGKFLVK